MSVLFKALAKAAKTREAVAGTAAPVGQPAILSRGSSGPGRKRLFAMIGALCLGAAAGSYLFFFTDDDTKASVPAGPPVSTPHPRPILTPSVVQQQAAAPALAQAEPAGAGAAVPAPSAPVVAAQPSSEQPVVKLAPLPPTGPAPALEPASDSVKTRTALALPPGAMPAVKAKPQGPVMPIEDDLPTLLERLRQQKGPSHSVVVSRVASRRDLLDDDGRSAIQVGVAPQSGQDAARIAYGALLQGHYDEALDNYNKAIAAEPRSASLLLGKATALQKLGQVPEARRTYNMVLALDPGNREALTNQTTLLAAQSPERALADLAMLKQANPRFSPIEAEIGAQQAALGNAPAAIEALGNAVMLSPENGLYRLNLAILQDRAGLRADAATSYRAALSLLSDATGLPLPTDQIKQRLAYLEGR